MMSIKETVALTPLHSIVPPLRETFGPVPLLSMLDFEWMRTFCTLPYLGTNETEMD